MSTYRKFIVAILVAVAIATVTAVGSALQDEVITAQEWCTIALAALGALAVYVVPNTPPATTLTDGTLDSYAPEEEQ